MTVIIRAIGAEGETTMTVPSIGSVKAERFYHDAMRSAYTRSFGVNPWRVEVEFTQKRTLLVSRRAV